MRLDKFARKELEGILDEQVEKDGYACYPTSNLVTRVIMWVAKRQRKEKEEVMDAWFEGMPDIEKCGIAEGLWDNLSFEEKMEEFTREF